MHWCFAKASAWSASARPSDRPARLVLDSRARDRRPRRQLVRLRLPDVRLCTRHGAARDSPLIILHVYACLCLSERN